MRGTRPFMLSALVMALPLLAGCATMQPWKNTGADVSGSTRVAEVDLGKSVDGNDRIADTADDFMVTEPVYAVVQTEGNSSAKLTIKWIHENQTTVDQRTTTVGPGSATKTFRLGPNMRSGDWRFEVYLNNTFMKAETFEVHA